MALMHQRRAPKADRFVIDAIINRWMPLASTPGRRTGADVSLMADYAVKVMRSAGQKLNMHNGYSLLLASYYPMYTDANVASAISQGKDTFTNGLNSKAELLENFLEAANQTLESCAYSPDELRGEAAVPHILEKATISWERELNPQNTVGSQFDRVPRLTGVEKYSFVRPYGATGHLVRPGYYASNSAADHGRASVDGYRFFALVGNNKATSINCLYGDIGPFAEVSVKVRVTFTHRSLWDDEGTTTRASPGLTGSAFRDFITGSTIYGIKPNQVHDDNASDGWAEYQFAMESSGAIAFVPGATLNANTYIVISVDVVSVMGTKPNVLVGWDSNGNALTAGKRLVDYIGSSPLELLLRIEFSSKTKELLGELERYEEFLKRGRSGVTNTFSMTTILQDYATNQLKLASAAVADITQDRLFQLDFWFGDTATLYPTWSSEDLRSLYVKWYQCLPSFIAMMICDPNFAQSVEASELPYAFV
jgi:hypothetical protein